MGLGYCDESEQEWSILQRLLPAGSRQFAIYVNSSNYEVTLGGWDPKMIAKGDSKEGYGIHWYDMIEEVNNSWEISMQDARYGYQSFVRGKADRVMFSAGQKYMYVPASDFDYLAGLWEDKIATVNCEERGYCYMKNTSCSDIA